VPGLTAFDGVHEKARIMKTLIGGDRRGGDRRQDPTAQGGRRKGQRRKSERRRFVRLYYPSNAAPKVLNRNFCIINISHQGIVFVCQDRCDKCLQPITLKSVLDLKIQFHDGQILDVKVRIIRCQSDLASNENHYAGLIEGGILPERISKEQAYLLRYFHDFCTFSRVSAMDYLETALYIGNDADKVAAKSIE